MRWVIGIVVVVVLVILGYQYFGDRGVDVAEQPEVGVTDETQVAEPAEEPAVEVTEPAEEAAGEAEQAAEETAEETMAATEEAGEQAAEATGEVAGEVEEATEALSEEVTEEAQQVTEEVAEETGAATEEATGAADEAAQTAALVVGDVNVGEQLTGAVQSTEDALEGITDAQSAEAAVPALNAINTRLEELSDTVDELPDDAKKVLADLLSERVTELKTLADNVTGQEGVGDVVSPALEPIIAKLEDWAQAPA